MPVYELTDGDAMQAVENLCRHLAGPNGFGTTTHPTLDDVRQIMDMAYYKIGGRLSQANYPTTSTSAAVLGFLQNLQVLETVILLELSYPITGPGEPNERFQAFISERDALYEALLDGALDGLGGSSTRFAGVTGVSIATKDSVRQDTDLVPFRFRRGLMAQPSTDPSQVLVADTPGG